MVQILLHLRLCESETITNYRPAKLCGKSVSETNKTPSYLFYHCFFLEGLVIKGLVDAEQTLLTELHP